MSRSDAITIADVLEGFKDLGIDISIDELKSKIPNYTSVWQLAKDEYYSHLEFATFGEMDFIIGALGFLWRQLAPDRFYIELLRAQLDGRSFEDVPDEERYDEDGDLTDEAYDALLDQWARGWEFIKSIVPSTITDIADIRELKMDDLGYIVNDWVLTYISELQAAGFYKALYFERLLQFVLGLQERFPDSDLYDLQYWTRCEAEAYAYLGDRERAVAILSAYIEEYPEDAYGYARLGDVYTVDIPDRGIHADHAAARDAYRSGLGKSNEDSMLLRSIDALEDSD